MKNITYTPTLKEHLEFITKASNELAKEEQNKSVEQFLAEVEFIENLLKELKLLVALANHL